MPEDTMPDETMPDDTMPEDTMPEGRVPDDPEDESGINLTTTSYLVLGLVRECGTATPYELKAVVDGSIGYFWDFPRSQLYAESARLAAAGLLAEERESGGRRRRRFRITRAGEDALGAWVATPAETTTELRDLGLLKLFFADAVDDDDVAALAHAQVEAHRRRLAEYEDIATALRDGAEPAPRATLELGLRYERMAVAFWSEVAARPPRLERPGRSVTAPRRSPASGPVKERRASPPRR